MPNRISRTCLTAAHGLSAGIEAIRTRHDESCIVFKILQAVAIFGTMCTAEVV